MFHILSRDSAPLGLKWRSSVWFITLVVGAGITTDVLFYTIIIPVIPFRLEALGYKDPSSLTGYLLLAFSAGLVFFTPPIAWFSERFQSRRTLLLAGIMSLIGAQILFMLAPVFWALIISRIIQGISSSVIWTVGSALLCDAVPEDRIGQQFGIALTGLSFGAAIGPAVGGALYDSFGFRAPFIFSLGLLGFDLVLRFLVIEKQDALRWGFDPTATSSDDHKDSDIETITPDSDDKNGVINDKKDDQGIEPKTEIPSRNTQSSLQITLTILRSRRAMAASLAILIFGTCVGMLEPTIPLRFQQVYGYTSLKVGLVFMGATFPTIISSTISGMLSDKYGTGRTSAVCFLFSLPWFLVLAIHGPVALFIVGIILLYFFVGTITAPAMAELADLARSTKGIGYSHIYGLFNLTYGTGTCIGPIIGSQLFDHVRNGFTVLLGIATFLFLLALGFVVVCMGDVPLLMQIKSKLGTSSSDSVQDTVVETQSSSNVVVI